MKELTESARPPSLLDWRGCVLLAMLAASIVGVLLVGHVRSPYPEWPAQWQSYYDFADRRAFARVPNFGDVVSNLPFVIVGAWAFFFVWHARLNPGGRFTEPWERRCFLAVAAFIFLTGVGSAYFHWSPSNATLTWDRLPIAAVFMGMFALVIGERISAKLGARLWIPLIVAGAASVVYWHFTEASGHGDLRPYGVVQFYPLVAIPFILLAYPPKYTAGRYYIYVFAAYGIAKVLETNDARVLELLGGAISGHTLKHLAAAAATGYLFLLVRKRRAMQ